jgi:hypothetical protein
MTVQLEMETTPESIDQAKPDRSPILSRLAAAVEAAYILEAVRR